MVGPWQVPVADCAVTLTDYDGTTGEAMAIGERTPLALLDARRRAHGGRRGHHQHRRRAHRQARRHQAVRQLDGRRRPSGRGRRLYDTVRAVGMELCPALGIAIPVGKDSMSMKTVWQGRTASGTR
jgi:phosphoribosylformylglycinamidine synthase